MNLALWSVLAGTLLLVMGLGNTLLARLPFSSAMLYLGVGLALSPGWLGAVQVNAAEPSKWLEWVAEVVVVLSLFTSGLKLSAGWGDRRWLAPARLAVVGMLITVAAISVAGVFLLGLPWGAAVLLGGILAPTDPVLASEVQLTDPTDRDQLRFALTGEGGLNDGTAFPVVMLGLGLLGLHDLGALGWRWVAVDVVWAASAGVAIGALLGATVGRLVIYLRRTHRQAVGLDNFLALGLIFLAYGLALLMHAYGFLAVFAAGVALRQMERLATARAPQAAVAVNEIGESQEALATHPAHSSAYMAHAVLSFNEQLEKLGEAVAVVVLGMALWSVSWERVSWAFVALMLLVIRPASVKGALWGLGTLGAQRRLMGWFGIRGIGSVYYLAYAVNHGLPGDLAQTLSAFTLSVIAASIVLHGVSVTALMSRYQRRRYRAP
jgi:sodium/hydrogen antiporter